MKQKSILRTFTQWFAPAVCCWGATALLLFVLPPHFALAQEQNREQKEALEPDYLSARSNPANAPYGYGSGTGTFLGTAFTRSITWNLHVGKETATFPVRAGYNRFIATLGVDDTEADGNSRVTFSIIGIDKNGTEIILLSAAQAQARKPPKPINVDVSKCVLVKLEQKTDGANLGWQKAWWGDARFESGPAPAAKPQGSGAYSLTFDEAVMKQKLQELATELMKDMKGSDLAVGLFLLLPQPTYPLDAKVATGIQSALQNELQRNNGMLHIELLKENFSDTLGKFRPGDDLDPEPRKAIDSRVDQRYILLGTIRDDGENAKIYAAIYNVHTGKIIGEREAFKSIPIVARPPVVSKDGPLIDPAPEHTQAITFKPDKKLRLKSYHWKVDGKPQAEVSSNGASTTEVAIPQDKKKHKFELVWNGEGFATKDQKGQPATPYESVTIEFELEDRENMSVEVSAKVKESTFLVRETHLEVEVKVDGKTIKSNH